MSDRTRHAGLILILAVIASACTGSTLAPSAQPTRSGQTVPSTSPDSATPDSATPDSATGAALTQPWATATLTDVRTGEPFRIADLVASGKVVFLQPMAMWCSNCRAQQKEAVAAFDRLDRMKVVWIGLDVETAEDSGQLVRYSDENGFDFTYAIANPDLSRSLVAEFGEVVLSPPATNVIVIGVDGTINHTTGGQSADELVDLATGVAG